MKGKIKKIHINIVFSITMKPVPLMCGLAFLIILFTVILAPLYAEAKVSFQPLSVQMSLPQKSVFGDFNKDGKMDYAIPGSIYLGVGDGSLLQISTYNVGVILGAVDVDRDGNPDLVTETHFLKGRGDGTFDNPVSYNKTWIGDQLQTANFNGKKDEIIYYSSDGCGSIFNVSKYNNGQISIHESYRLPSLRLINAAADFDNDGKDEFVFDRGNGFFIVKSNAQEFFSLPRTRFLSVTPGAINAGDFNADGRADISVGAPHFSNLLAIDHAGNYQSTETYDIPYLLNEYNYTEGTTDYKKAMPVISDYNSDNHLDVAIGASLLTGNGLGGASYIENNISNGTAYKKGDFNGDGKDDLLQIDWRFNNFWTSLNNGNGKFTLSPSKYQSLNVGPDPEHVMKSDFNGDGFEDIAVQGDNISILINDSQGGFRPYLTVNVSDPFMMLSEDFNNDGCRDLAVLHGWNQNQLSIYLWDKDQNTFVKAVDYNLPNESRYMETGDFNKDGKVDIVYASAYANTISVLLGHGDGFFEQKSSYTVV